MTDKQMTEHVAKLLCLVREARVPYAEIILVVRNGEVRFVDYRGEAIKFRARDS